MNALLEKYFELIRGLIPSKPEGNSIGLDIGAGDCKLVELAKTEKGITLMNWAIEPIQDGKVSEAVKNILERVDNSYKALYTSVFGKGTLIRYIDMPYMSIDDLRNSFSIEADKYFPFVQDQIYTDCFILETTGKGKQMPVMAAATKKDIIDRRVKLLNELEISVNFIGINSVALANVIHALGVDDENKDAAVALLDMGNSVSNLTIMVNKLPRFTRDIFMGGRELTKRISNALGIGLQEAEQLKNNPQKRKEEILDVCESAVMNIVQELRLSFDYFTTEKNTEISKLLLTGGGSMLEGIAEIFSKHLDMDVCQWNPLSRLEISPEVDQKAVSKDSLKLGVAVGLALYDYD